MERVCNLYWLSKMRQEQGAATSSLDDTLDNIKGMIQHRDDLANMSLNILELTNVVQCEESADPAQSEQKANEQRYKLYVNGNKEDYVELDHEQIVLMVKDILTPHLQGWLNEHLPTIVREEVKEQIQLLIHRDNIS